MSLTPTLNDISRPRLIMKTLTSLRTLHSTITSEKVATHAQCKAMGLIGTDELMRLDCGQRHHEAIVNAGVGSVQDDVVFLVTIVQTTSQVVPISHKREFTEMEIIKNIKIPPNQT